MTSHDRILKMQHHPAVSLLVVWWAKTGQIKGLSSKCIFSYFACYTTCCSIGCSADNVQWVDIWRDRLCSGWLTETVGNPFSRELGSLWKLAFAGYPPTPTPRLSETLLMVAIPYCIYSCSMWHFLAFHEWQEVRRCILPKNLSTCWSHHVNYCCHIQYDRRCLFGGWIMTISWHRWQVLVILCQF